MIIIPATNLGRKALLYIFLHPAQQKGLQLLVQGAEAVGVALSVGPMGLLKCLPVRESPWHDEVEQRPQLLQGVLENTGHVSLHWNCCLVASVVPLPPCFPYPLLLSLTPYSSPPHPPTSLSLIPFTYA